MWVSTDTELVGLGSKVREKGRDSGLCTHKVEEAEPSQLTSGLSPFQQHSTLSGNSANRSSPNSAWSWTAGLLVLTYLPSPFSLTAICHHCNHRAAEIKSPDEKRGVHHYLFYFHKCPTPQRDCNPLKVPTLRNGNPGQMPARHPQPQTGTP